MPMPILPPWHVVSPLPMLRTITEFSRMRHPPALLGWVSAAVAVVALAFYQLLYTGDLTLLQFGFVMAVLPPVLFVTLMVLPQRGDVFEKRRVDGRILYSPGVYYKEGSLAAEIMAQHDAADVESATNSDNCCSWLTNGDCQMLIPFFFTDVLLPLLL